MKLKGCTKTYYTIKKPNNMKHSIVSNLLLTSCTYLAEVAGWRVGVDCVVLYFVQFLTERGNGNVLCGGAGCLRDPNPIHKTIINPQSRPENAP